MQGTDRRGAALAEVLTATVISALIMVCCLFGITAAARAAQAAEVRATANALAQTAAEYIKNEIRFAEDTDQTIRALSAYPLSLNGLSVDALTFEKQPDGTVIFRFTVAGFVYEYQAAPLSHITKP